MLRIIFFSAVFFPAFFFAQKEEILGGKWELMLEKRGDCGDSALIKIFKEASLLAGTGKIMELQPGGNYSCKEIFGDKFTSSKWKVVSKKDSKEIIFSGNKKNAAASFLQFKFIFASPEKIILMGGTESCKYYLFKKKL
jgi:hypothetical protein